LFHVDALNHCNSILVLEANTLERTFRQNKDEKIYKIRDKLESAEDKFYELKDSLYRKFKNKKLLFRKCMEVNIIRTCYDDLGHLGVDKVVDNIIKVY